MDAIADASLSKQRYPIAAAINVPGRGGGEQKLVSCDEGGKPESSYDIHHIPRHRLAENHDAASHGYTLKTPGQADQFDLWIGAWELCGWQSLPGTRPRRTY